MREFALATVSSRSYFEGTRVLLESFRRHNPWHEGEVLLFQDDLELREIEALQSITPVSCQDIPEHFLSKVREQKPNIEKFEDRYRRFFSLLCFSLTEYNRIVFLDSDTLVQSDISPLFSETGELSACPDRPTIIGQGRSKRTFRLCQPDDQDSKWERTFSAGVMSLRPSRPRLNSLIKTLSGAGTLFKASGMTDQVVLNLEFENDWSTLGGEWNFIVPIEGRSQNLGRPPAILHFVGPQKPWNNAQLAAHLLDHPERRPYYVAWSKVQQSLSKNRKV